MVGLFLKAMIEDAQIFFPQFAVIKNHPKVAFSLLVRLY
jgi:hypothetical protein